MTLEPPAVVPEPSGTIRCPRCNAPVAPDQDWCLECGAAARTRLAPTPNWRMPIVVIAVVAILAGAGLAVAFVALTNDSTSAPATTSAPAVATEPTAAAPPTTPPATTAAPPTTTATPTATTPTVQTPTTPATPATTDKQP